MNFKFERDIEQILRELASQQASKPTARKNVEHPEVYYNDSLENLRGLKVGIDASLLLRMVTQ